MKEEMAQNEAARWAGKYKQYIFYFYMYMSSGFKPVKMCALL